jgi:hypothetical protein
MKESFPKSKQETGLDGAEVLEVAASKEGFDSEAEWEKAQVQLEEMLDVVEVDEDIPEEFLIVAKLEKLLNEDLNPDFDPEVDNSMRFVAMTASAMYDKALREDMSQKKFEEWSTIKINKRMHKMMSERGIPETPEVPETA